MAPTATPDQQLALLAVQELDTAILQVRRRRADLALTKEVHDLEVEHGSLEMKIVAATTEVSDRTLDVRKAESDVEQVVNRATRDKERMDSGTVSAKELEGLQHELQSLAKRQAELEDVELLLSAFSIEGQCWRTANRHDVGLDAIEDIEGIVHHPDAVTCDALQVSVVGL